MAKARTTFYRAADGQVVSEAEALDEHGTIRSGYGIRGLCCDAAAARFENSDPTGQRKYEKRISDAWRSPASTYETSEAELRAARERAASHGITLEQAVFEGRISNSWRSRA